MLYDADPPTDRTTVPLFVIFPPSHVDFFFCYLCYIVMWGKECGLILRIGGWWRQRREERGRKKGGRQEGEREGEVR